MEFRFVQFISFAVAGLLLSIHAAKAQLPTGTPLLTNDISAYVPVGIDAPKSMIEEVSVTGQSFSKALRINTFVQENIAREVGITLPLTASVKKGDVLLLTFQSRSLKSTRESGEALLEVRLDELINGKYEWPCQWNVSIAEIMPFG